MRVLIALALVGTFIQAAEAANDLQYREAFAELDREFSELEIDLKQLDLTLTKAITYGWREDASEKLAEWRNDVKSAFSRFRDSLSNLFKRLTTRDGDRLPDWVYTATGGALDEVVGYLEKRMATEDDNVRAVILEVLRNSVRVYRNKVKSAGQQAGQEAKEEL